VKRLHGGSNTRQITKEISAGKWGRNKKNISKKKKCQKTQRVSERHGPSPCLQGEHASEGKNKGDKRVSEAKKGELRHCRKLHTHSYGDHALTYPAPGAGRKKKGRKKVDPCRGRCKKEKKKKKNITLAKQHG